jgi:hypothetical protein
MSKYYVLMAEKCEWNWDSCVVMYVLSMYTTVQLGSMCSDICIECVYNSTIEIRV